MTDPNAPYNPGDLTIDYSVPLTGLENASVLDALTTAPETMDPQLRHDAFQKALGEVKLDRLRRPFGVDAGKNAYGEPRIRRGAEFDTIFTFRDTVVANPASGNHVPAYVDSRESFEGSRFTDVYIEFDDDSMILIRRTVDTHGKKTQAEQKFEAMNTKRKKGEVGSPSNPKAMTAEELDGLVVTAGRPFITGKDAQGRSLVSRQNVRRVFAVNMDLNDTTITTGKIHPAEQNTIRKLDLKARFNEVHHREMDRLRREQALAHTIVSGAIASQP